MIECRNILEIVNLSTLYNANKVLNSVNCNIRFGTIVGVIGEEGSGKSTLINSITQSLVYTGEVFYNNLNLSSYKTHQLSQLGIDFMPQGGSIFSRFTVNEHIEFALKLNKENWSQTEGWCQIEVFFPKLVDMKKRLGGTLSGGERIMLSLSCLLVSNCNFLLLDEPTSGLSPEVCNSIKPLFNKWKKEKKTILMTEHNYDFAIDLSDEILVLTEGKLSSPYTREISKQLDFVEKKLYKFVSK